MSEVRGKDDGEGKSRFGPSFMLLGGKIGATEDFPSTGRTGLNERMQVRSTQALTYGKSHRQFFKQARYSITIITAYYRKLINSNALCAKRRDWDGGSSGWSGKGLWQCGRSCAKRRRRYARLDIRGA
jgi:hypothetical protein